MSNRNVFLQRGNTFNITEGNFSVMPILDEGIYQILQNPMSGELFLQKIAQNFHFGFKLYGIDTTLVKHVVDTYQKQPVKRNIGVLLNGAKGTGKTVTAKVMANKLGLPVILCDRPYPGLSNFLASIGHDCVFFFDEFEKNFRMKCDDDDCAGESLLSIMDGVYNADHCHIFILTTNELRINDNLISRPSRIRYLKSFGSVIDRQILEDFVEDALEDKSKKGEIMDFVDSLTMATIDIVKSIVEEVNIHNCSVEDFRRFFNVKEASFSYFVRRWNFSEDSEFGIKKEDFLKAAKAPYSSNCEWRPTFDNFKFNKSVKKLNVGDMVTDRYKIVNLDLEASYMLCEDVRYPKNFVHYYFENIDAEPNLYNDTVTYAYNRNHYDDFYDF
jgi:hypothetical protein